jgi:hypothetical protein
MIERIKDFFMAKAIALSTLGAGGAATAHACAHPCAEHIALGVVVWVVGLFCTIRNRVRG